MGLKPSHFIKLKTREKATGTRTKMRNPAKLGRIKDIPTKVLRIFNGITRFFPFAMAFSLLNYIDRKLLSH
jgi:hypothetical protein